MKKIKVVNTPVRFYPYLGGVEYSTYYLCKELVKIGISIKVICARTSIYEPTNIDGIKINRLNFICKIANTNITLSLPLWLMKEKYDIVHTHMPTPWAADWSILIAKLKGIKSIITIHNDMDKPGFIPKIVTSIYIHSLFRVILTLVDKIIIINPDWKNSFISTSKILKHFQNKIIIITNGVDLSFFKPIKLIRQHKAVLFISILDKHHLFKGLDFLLEAMVKIIKVDPQVILTVIGEGELKKFYINKSVNLGISSHVEFIGKKNQKQLIDYYSKSTLFILPSIGIEAFGNVLVEAMACETPVITTPKAGMFRDIEETNSGIVIPPSNSDEIFKAVLKILNNPSLAKDMGINGRKLVTNKYSWEKIACQNKKLYEDLLR